MRHILAAGLLLSPLFFTAAAVASTPATDASLSTPVRPVSTGVIPAQFIFSPVVQLDPTEEIQNNAVVDLKLTIGADGRASNIEVVRSANPLLNAPVVAAVSKARFRPATLDHQAIAVPVNLAVTVQN